MRILKYTIKKIQVFLRVIPSPFIPVSVIAGAGEHFSPFPLLPPFCGYPANIMPLKCPPLWASKGFSEFS